MAKFMKVHFFGLYVYDSISHFIKVLEYSLIVNTLGVNGQLKLFHCDWQAGLPGHLVPHPAPSLPCRISSFQAGNHKCDGEPDRCLWPGFGLRKKLFGMYQLKRQINVKRGSRSLWPDGPTACGAVQPESPTMGKVCTWHLQ